MYFTLINQKKKNKNKKCQFVYTSHTLSPQCFGSAIENLCFSNKFTLRINTKIITIRTR